MELLQAETLARELMDHHGLDGWSFQFDRAKRRAGMVNYDKKILSLSKVLTEIYDAEQVRLVIIHEIAHALVGPHHHHDATWKRMCISLGGDGQAQLTGGPEPEPTWIGTCPSGHITGRFRRPQSVLSCARCAPVFSHEAVFTWKNTTTGVIISPTDLPTVRNRPRKARRRFRLGRRASS